MSVHLGRSRASGPTGTPDVRERVEVFWEEDGCVRRRVVHDVEALLRELGRPGVRDVQVRRAL